jgi:hypothetical protein
MGKLDLDELLKSGFKPMTNEQQSRKWYQKKRLIIPALVLFPLLGIPLVWLSTWNRNQKIGATDILRAIFDDGTE